MAEGSRLGHRPRRPPDRFRLPGCRDSQLASRPASLRPDVLIVRMPRLASPLTSAEIVCALLLAAPAAAFEVQVKDVSTPSASVTTTIEVRDLLPDRFKKTLDGGGALHLRVQAELWESRPVWDRLVYP